MLSEPPPQWETFAHEADVGVRGTGRTLAEAFAGAALALTSVLCDPSLVRPERELRVVIEEEDPELLFYAWLSEVIFQMDVEGMLFSRYDVRIEAGRLEAVLAGERVDRARHEPTVEVKAATWNELRVEHLPDGSWLAQAVVDV